jgi:hypothetical protein
MAASVGAARTEAAPEAVLRDQAALLDPTRRFATR